MLKPLRNYVLIKPDSAEEILESGIVLPKAQKSSFGTVVAVGVGHYDNKGKFHPIGISVGDRVMFNPSDNTEQKIDGETYQLIPAAHLIGKITQ